MWPSSCQVCYLGADLLQGLRIDLVPGLWRIEIVLKLSKRLREVLQVLIVGIGSKLALAQCDKGGEISLN